MQVNSANPAKMVSFTLYLPPELRQAMEAHSAEFGTPLAEICRRGAQLWMQRMQERTARPS